MATDFEMNTDRAAAPDVSAATQSPEADRFTSDERRTLSVLAFLFLRMGAAERAARLYEALLALIDEARQEDETGSLARERRLALAGLAAARLDAGAAPEALASIDEALGLLGSLAALSTREAALHLLKAQILWALDRKTEAHAARDRFLELGGAGAAAADGLFSDGTNGDHP